MNMIFPTKTIRFTWLPIGIILFLTVEVIPSLAVGQVMNPQVVQNSKNMDTVETPQEMLVGISKKIKLILPVGWSLKQEKNIITIKRDKPIEWYNTISLPAHRNLAELKEMGFVHSRNYTISLVFFSPMSKAMVDKLAKENQRIIEQHYQKHPRPKNSKPFGLPRDVRQSLHQIPNILTEQYSVLVTPFIHGPGMAFFDEQDKKECENVEQNVRELLKSKQQQDKTGKS